MTICSPSTGNITLRLRPRAILPASGEQIVMLPSHKVNNCIMHLTTPGCIGPTSHLQNVYSSEDNWYTSTHLSTSPLTSEVVRAPQMTLQQYVSIRPCPLLPSGNLQTPSLSIPWCYLPISSSVVLFFLLISLSPAELSSPCQRILRFGHTLLSCLDRSPFCTLWWLYRDGLPGRQLLLPLLHLRQCHLRGGSW